MAQFTVTINLTDLELEAFNFLAMAYDETETESVKSYVGQGVRTWLECQEIVDVPRAKRPLAAIRKQDEEDEKREKEA
jgi:hypothetical protein